MQNEEQTRSEWRGFLPRGRMATMMVIGVAVLAFVIGMLFGGDGSTASLEDDGHGHAAAAVSDDPTAWTCSMHPQIQLPTEGKCPLCFMDLIPVETGAGEELDPRQIRMSETARQLAGIQTTEVVRASARREIRMVGRIDYDETRLAYITAWVPGRLADLYVAETGQRVNIGDPLVELYSPQLIAAQEELVQAARTLERLSATSGSGLRETAGQTVDAARAKLRLWGLTLSQIEAIEAGGKASQYTTIIAPASGVVVHMDAREGMYAETGTRLYTIADLSKLWVLLEAYESDLPWLQSNGELTFTVGSLPGEEFDAVIDFVDPIVNSKTRTVQIRALVDNDDGRLKPQMFVSGTIQARLEPAGRKGAGEDPLVIPATAPLITGRRAVVYVELTGDDGPLFEGREIALGPRAGDVFVVTEGLAEGDRVVSHGAFKLDSELQLQARPSMMSPTGGGGGGHQHHGSSASAPMATQSVEEKVTPLATSVAAQQELSPVYLAYFEVQMGLANDDLDAATVAYGRLVDALAGVDMNMFTGEAHMRWMEASVSLTEAAQKGKAAENIEMSRDAFYTLSQAAIMLHDSFGHEDGSSFYLTFCPMARDNTGAYWLQQENIVWNSFYGDMMLRCGEIKEEIPGGSTGEK